MLLSIFRHCLTLYTPSRLWEVLVLNPSDFWVAPHPFPLYSALSRQILCYPLCWPSVYTHQHSCFSYCPGAKHLIIIFCKIKGKVRFPGGVCDCRSFVDVLLWLPLLLTVVVCLVCYFRAKLKFLDTIHFPGRLFHSQPGFFPWPGGKYFQSFLLNGFILRMGRPVEMNWRDRVLIVWLTVVLSRLWHIWQLEFLLFPMELLILGTSLCYFEDDFRGDVVHCRVNT